MGIKRKSHRITSTATSMMCECVLSACALGWGVVVRVVPVLSRCVQLELCVCGCDVVGCCLVMVVVAKI